MPFKPELPDSMPRIYKYTIGYIDRGILAAKIEGHPVLNILDIQEQDDILVLWAAVDTAKKCTQTTIQIYSAYTGDPPAGEGWSYFKTIQSDFNGLVYHLYIKNN